MNSKPRTRRSHCAKSEPPPIEPDEVIGSSNAAWELLYSAAGLPEWEGAPDPATMYGFAIREMSILARLCPDLQVRFAAVKFLAQEFAPQVPSEGEEERERRMAHIEIEQILRAKGLRPPQDAPIELETLEEQESEP